MGTTLRQVIFDLGGGIPNGKKFKAAQTGGPSGGCLTEEHLDLPIDYEHLAAAGSIMGSGGLIVMDEDACMVDVARFFLEFTQDESCGKCTPCRVGTKRMLEILTRITRGEGKEEDLTTLEELAETIKSTALWSGPRAPNPVLSILNTGMNMKFISEIKVSGRVCQHSWNIKSSRMSKGWACARNCPEDAITGEPKSHIRSTRINASNVAMFE